MRQLHAQKGRRVRRHRSRQRRAETREKRAQPALAVDLTDDPANRHIAALGRLQPRFDRVDREHGDPHGHAGSSTSTRNGRQAELARGLACNRVHRREAALDILVGGKVRGGARAIAGQGGGGPAEDGAHATLAVELADDVDAARIAGFLARLELLVLDLQDDFDTLEGGGDGGHGDGGEETGGGDLGDGEGAVGGGYGGDGADEVLAYVVAPEGDGDWNFLSIISKRSISLGQGVMELSLSALSLPWRGIEQQETYT